MNEENYNEMNAVFSPHSNGFYCFLGWNDKVSLFSCYTFHRCVVFMCIGAAGLCSIFLSIIKHENGILYIFLIVKTEQIKKK